VSEPRETLKSAESVAPKKALLGENMRRLAAKEAVALIGALLLLLAAFTIASPHFLNTGNMLNIGRSVAIMGISAAGVTIGLVGGVFDLSIASVADLANVATTIAHLNYGLAAIPALLVGLVVGLVCGAVNGVVVTRLRINPIIGTLGTAGIYRGIAFLLTNGQSHAVASTDFRFLGRTRVLGIPSALIVMLIVMAIGYVILRHTRFGRNTYAIGGNPVASRLAGINVDRQRLGLFMLVSFGAALSGLVLLSKLGTMIPNASAGTELDIIAAAILGGTALSGGGGTIQGTLVGVLILGTLRNGLVINNVNAYWQEVASGIALIIAVGIDRLRTGGYR
jgi:ribose transport system permease protein